MGAAGSTAVPAQTRSRSRFDRRLARILDHATNIFCDKGYERASMRDLSRACAMSLAGLYYYFDSKERLLYLIEKQLFERVSELLDEKLQAATDPEQRVRLFIENHITFFLSKRKAMKVLAREDDVLTGNMGSEIEAIKRNYYRRCTELLEELRCAKGLHFRPRSIAMALFGTMNCLHTWYNPKLDSPPRLLAKEISDIFLCGVYAKNGSASIEPSLSASL
jgi:AcrR family transcriptional regulator